MKPSSISFIRIFTVVSLTADMNLVCTLIATIGCIFVVAIPFLIVYKVLCFIRLLWWLEMRFKKIIKLFEDQNVCVCGLRGTGKDLLMSNVVIRRKLRM